jgi:hypothetical protein
MNNKNEEPAWLDPKNDRKKPYTTEEIEIFVTDFIELFPEYYAELLKKNSPAIAREIVRRGFENSDDNRQKPYCN